MDFRIIVAIGFVLLFYRMAVYEHMTGWVWAVSSFALSFIVMILWGGFLPMFVAQLGLFGALWVSNAKRVDTRQQDWVKRQEGRRRGEGKRMRRAQEEIKRDRQKGEPQ